MEPTKKIIIDRSYGLDIRDPRYYFKYSPTLRTGGGRFEVLEIEYEQQETTDAPCQ